MLSVHPRTTAAEGAGKTINYFEPVKSKYLHSQQLPDLDPTSKLVNPSLCFLFNPNVAQISVASPTAILNSVQRFSH
ncbi:hypothetical protein CEXT_567001 [Caerostris extrusa]|uniref:Uncharacterized protein n=1 Tax=Caerostris extrusa TaxID=172846 RepID=A0AAV4WUE2_CAEEX|nr:hypothetical protein CEXT_567001 [Caerostris extrusa]